ncbi:MAG: zinc ribbon domain-containing protein [Acidobacteria bacterium]|nr:zinc ribbon domain-containing protein [Acidobacteriota bacterium]
MKTTSESGVTAAVGKEAGPYRFQVAKADLGPLFVDTLRLSCHPFSPLAERLSSYVPGSGRATGGLAELAGDASVCDAAGIVARPAIRMMNRTGGGALEVSWFAACHGAASGDDRIVVVTPSFEEALLFEIFDTPAAFSAHWAALVGSRVEEDAPNYIGAPLPLESWVYVLHAIDAFRRTAFTSQLDYVPMRQPFIRPAEFVTSMTQSLQSGDLRWLLPAFLALTPNLDVSGFNPRDEHLEALATYDFLLTGKHPDSGEPVLVFGDAGRAMGVEFYRTWMMSVGFELSVPVQAGLHVVHRGFLAPTAFANHLMLIDAAAGRQNVVTHEALTHRALRQSLDQMMRRAVAWHTAEATRPAATPAAGVTFCPGCGAGVRAGAKFCGACGKRVG